MFIQAHRGFSDGYPENTMIAFEKAVEAGATHIETDLAVSSDDHVVLIHDRSLERTTNGSGLVSSVPLDVLQGLDAGVWMGSNYAGERIPTLRDTLMAFKDRAVLNLEIKSRRQPLEYVQRVVDRALITVREHDALASIVFSSFETRALLEVRRKAPQAKLVLIDWTEDLDQIHFAREHRFHGWVTRRVMASEERVRAAKAAGLQVFIGLGVDFSDQIFQLIDWGTDVLSTENPRSLAEFLRR